MFHETRKNISRGIWSAHEQTQEVAENVDTCRKPLKPRVLLISLILFAIISLSTFLRYNTTVTGQKFQLHPPIMLVANGDFTRPRGVRGGDERFLTPVIILGLH